MSDRKAPLQDMKHTTDAAYTLGSTAPCTCRMAELPSEQFDSILAQLLHERFEEKRKIIERIFTLCDQKWDDTLLKVAIRSFGFGIQNSVFEEWANVLNTQALGKHRDNPTQIEAILFGQAGLLEIESIPYYYRDEAMRCAYYNELTKEYRFLSNKFQLTSIDHKKWNCGTTTPHLRIARVASLYHLGRLTISGITTANNLTDIYRLFAHPLNGYWQNHTCFGGTATVGNGCMKQRQVDIIIINSVVPILHIYGKHRKEERYCEMSKNLLYSLAPEENSIIRKWRTQGVAAKNAADTQALLQLSRSYCKANECNECPFGNNQ